ncbi:DNA polymerase alpha, subunit B [Marasmius fiardii PR-910]|nr:DNA polymerase alpha, subunit B [Marasmius fiardii PR-910]
MSEGSISQEISRRLGDEVASNPKLLEECLSICRIYNLTPEQLQFKWEAATFSSMPARAHEAARFTMDSLAGVKAQIKREMNQNSTAKAQPRNFVGAAAVNRSRLPQFMAQNMRMNVGRGGAGEVKIKAEPSGGLEPASLAGPSRPPSKVVFKGPKTDAFSRKNRAYRYMYEKLSQRSEVLDDRIDEFGELVREHYGIAELGDPSSITDEEIVVVGRITHDSEIPSESSNVKLTEATLTLESSRMLCGGVRVPLRFEESVKIRGGAQGAGALTLFPGSIVALKGKNGSGSWFSASEILALPPISPAKSDSGAEDSSFSMAVCCGPYTPDSDLKFTPWQSLLRKLKKSRPLVIVLTGPFLDCAHPLVESGDIDETPLVLFHRIFLEPLRQFLDSSPGSIAILMPSVRDLISSHAVYPQCELGLEITKHDARIHLLPNPARFSVNGVKFATTSVDVLFHLRKEEVTKRGEEVDSIPPQFPEDTGSDSMGNSCRHLLQQRSFYPIFPVPGDVTGEVNLDVSHSEALKLGGANADEFAPDVFIIPSKLKQFSKRVNSTLFINPSCVSKSVYATLNLAASEPGVSLASILKGEVIKMQGDE